MKNILIALLLLCTAGLVQAQQSPARTQPSLTKPEMAHRRFTAQLNRLKIGLSQKDVYTTNSFYASVLLAMRLNIQESEGEAAAQGNSSAKSKILAAFEGFEFDVNNAAANEPKLLLLEEFLRMLQSEAIAGK